MNLLDIYIHAEYFFMHFLNLIYDWNLVNQNNLTANAPGIDLRDDVHKILIQVTSIVSRDKAQHSLDKLDAKAFKGYRFKFLSIYKDANKLRSKEYVIPEGINFDPENDVLDLSKIYNVILGLDIDRQKGICDLILKYMSIETPAEKRFKGLSRIIQILSGDNYLNDVTHKYENREFEITEKIQTNKLVDLLPKIHDLSLHQTDVDKVYNIYDAEGVNKSRSVLHAINKVYLHLKKELEGEELFDAIAEKVYQSLQGEIILSDYNDEDIRFYIDIILTDAFVRCKIFANPKTIQ